MTRASLLHILDHVGAISEAEVRELEQLAAAFPYCQTAHLLLAKAAHDRGNMLASQHLRRAATYAADRQLLRQLLEQPAPAPEPVPKALEAHTGPETERTLTAGPGNATAFFEAMVTEDVQPLEFSADEAGTSAVQVLEELPSHVVATPDEIFASPVEAETNAAAESNGAEVPTTNAAEPSVEAVSVTEAEAEAQQVEEPVFETQVEAQPAASAAAAPMAAEAAHTQTEAEPSPDQADEAAIAKEASPPQEQPEPAATEQEDTIPAAAPPIRPPVEAGVSRFEFGLSEESASSGVPTLYQLPGLDEGEEESEETSSGVAAFFGDAELAYALLGGGSRLGYCLQAKADELTHTLPQAAFFEPDALLVAHANTGQPRRAPLPSSFELINRFLKNKPRLKSPAVLPPTDEQADLSVRSTSVKPELASESLAKIMIRQGKIDKAIEIYERLMMRQPEKSAYFVDQIQQLKTPE